MNKLLSWWRGHGTKILGSATALIPTLLAIDDLIPPAQRKWWLTAAALLGVLTVNRGFTNSANQGSTP